MGVCLNSNDQPEISIQLEVPARAYQTSSLWHVLKDWMLILESSDFTSVSDSFAPSMRVDEPMLSAVATLCSASRRSDERVL